MSSHSPALKSTQLIDELTRLNTTSDREELLQRMRAAGLDRIASIKLLRKLAGISLGDAKIAIHYSSTWADCKQGSEELHATAFHAAGLAGFEEVDSAGRDAELAETPPRR